MKYNILILILLFIGYNSYSQKKINIPKNEIGNYIYIKKQIQKLNINDLTNNKSNLVIRIWRNRHVIEISKKNNTISGKIISFIYPAIKFSNKIFYRYLKIDEEKTKKIFEIFSSNKIFSLKGEDTSQVLFHGDIYIFEISTNNEYRIFSYYPLAGTNAEKLIIQTEEALQLDTIDETFINSLPPGSYFTGLSPAIHIDEFCKENMQTSTLYKHVKEILLNDFFYDETQKKTEFPLIILNNRISKMCELNQYEYEQVKKIKIFSDTNATDLFGDIAINGVVYITLKK